MKFYQIIGGVIVIGVALYVASYIFSALISLACIAGAIGLGVWLFKKAMR